MPIRIERLTTRHDVSSFVCRNPEYTSFLKADALRYETEGAAHTYVAVDSATQKIAGYISITFAAVAIQASGYPHSLPTMHIGKLAVSTEFKGQNVGPDLIFFAFECACRAATQWPVYAIDLLVDKNGEQYLRGYYSRFGFISIPNSRKMYVKLEYVNELIRQAAKGY